MNTQIQSFPLPTIIHLAPDEATATFIPIDRAEALAARLTETDEDGWTFTARPSENGRTTLQVHDREGTFIGLL